MAIVTLTFNIPDADLATYAALATKAAERRRRRDIPIPQNANQLKRLLTDEVRQFLHDLARKGAALIAEEDRAARLAEAEAIVITEQTPGP